jgi:hypothetical protein
MEEFVNMSAKLNKKLLLVSVAACSLLLASCNDKVYPGLSSDAKVSENQSILTNDDLTYIYEKLHDSSSTGATIRDVILERYAKGYIGNFTLLEDGTIKLEGYDDESAETQLEFVKKHEIYWDKKETEEGSKIYKATEPTELTEDIKNRVQLLKDIVKEKVAKRLFDDANSSSYKEDNYFYEYKFARAKFESTTITGFDDDLSKDGAVNIYDEEWERNYEDLAGPEVDTYPFTNKILIDSTISSDNIDSFLGSDNSTGAPMLHLGLYAKHVNKNIIPDILDTLLVEQYILDNQYTTLSRTQARKINYVSIATDTTNVNAARRLVENFVADYISGNGSKKTDAVKDGEYQPIDFDVLSEAWKGVFTDNASYVAGANESVDLLLESNFQIVKTHDEAINNGKTGTSYIDGADHYFFKNTDYGSLITDYAKINDDKNDGTSNEQWLSFTNSSTYELSKGLELKINDLKTKSYVTTGWGTKDNGFSSLPSAISDILFKYNVSVDTPINTGEFQQSDFIVEENGRYFLKKQNAQTEQLKDSVILRDGSTFYIVEVEEAISQSKLSLSSEDYTTNEKEAIAREIGYNMASGDTYKNTAYLHYLEKLDFKYHDQSIYDYMLSAYPDLFD